jgi:hypothetical protein
MTMRAQRNFKFSSSEFPLEIRLCPASMSPYAIVGTSLATPSVQHAADDDPLPDPDPSPDPLPPEPEPTDPFPGLPPSGPAGPGTS